MFFRSLRRVRSVDLRMREKQILDKVLGPKVYDRRIRPGGGGNATGKYLFVKARCCFAFFFVIHARDGENFQMSI